VISPTPTPWATTVLLIDENDIEQAFYAQGLMRCSSDYLILEAADRQSGLDRHRQSQWIDCVVLELVLPNSSGFALLVGLIPIPSRPNIVVVILTRVRHRGWWDLAKQIGAHACLLKELTSTEDLDRAIQRAVACVGLMPKEDRHRPI
jgi:DNA-binding NarL/FixJ family response regulator